MKTLLRQLAGGFLEPDPSPSRCRRAGGSVTVMVTTLDVSSPFFPSRADADGPVAAARRAGAGRAAPGGAADGPPGPGGHVQVGGGGRGDSPRSPLLPPSPLGAIAEGLLGLCSSPNAVTMCVPRRARLCQPREGTRQDRCSRDDAEPWGKILWGPCSGGTMCRGDPDVGSRSWSWGSSI